MSRGLYEFGGTMGILTTEDIIEELVGEIWDEADTIVPDYVQVSENVYLVDGDMNIYDFLELVDYPDKEFETEYTTVGGWCTEILERFPEAGDTFNWGNLHLEIVQAEQMRVEKVRVTINQPQDEENNYYGHWHGQGGDHCQGMHIPCGERDQYSGHFPDHCCRVF